MPSAAHCTPGSGIRDLPSHNPHPMQDCFTSEPGVWRGTGGLECKIIFLCVQLELHSAIFTVLFSLRWRGLVSVFVVPPLYICFNSNHCGNQTTQKKRQ